MGLLTEPVGEASLGGCRGEISGPHAVPKVLRQREAERENEGYVYVMSGPPPHPHPPPPPPIHISAAACCQRFVDV